MLRMKPGSLVVLEGLDGAGKSTIAGRLRDAETLWADTPLFTHSPSGGSAVGNAVYAVTEHGIIQSPWARQFLHLAAHAEEYRTIINPHLQAGGSVWMDRNWWSTVAYGFFGGNIRTAWRPEEVPFEFAYRSYENLARIPTEGTDPDIVFLFMHPWVEDRHNTKKVREGYEYLQNQYPDICYVVEPDSIDRQIVDIFEVLSDRELVTTEPA